MPFKNQYSPEAWERALARGREYKKEQYALGKRWEATREQKAAANARYKKRYPEANCKRAVRYYHNKVAGGPLPKDLTFLGDACFDCGSKDNASIGHILPTSKGGSNNPRNLIRQCRSCNSRQSNRIHWLFMTYRCVGEMSNSGG